MQKYPDDLKRHIKRYGTEKIDRMIFLSKLRHPISGEKMRLSEIAMSVGVTRRVAEWLIKEKAINDYVKCDSCGGYFHITQVIRGEKKKRSLDNCTKHKIYEN